METDFSALDPAVMQYAEEDRITTGAGRELPARTGVEAILEWLQAACLACGKAGTEASKAAEWLLDNDYVVHRALRQIRQDLPDDFYGQLPPLEGGEGDGFPRAFVLAHRYLSISRMQVSAAALSRFLSIYQRVAPLRIGEIWAFPAMLRIACIEVLVETLSNLLCDHLDTPVATTTWAQEAHALEANERVARAIANLSNIDAISWEDLFDEISEVEQILRTDPSEFYGKMDFESRDHYRRALENLARHSQKTESEIARLAVATSNTAAANLPCGHVGYWLVGEGRKRFQRQVGAVLPLHARVQDLALTHPGVVYGLSLVMLLAGALFLPAGYLHEANADTTGWIAGLSLSLIPASVVATIALHWSITRLLPPRVLCKLDFTDGLAEDCPTLIAVPVVIARPDEVPALIERIENHWLSNGDPKVEIVLLADLADAPTECLPNDSAIEKALEQEIVALNARYAGERGSPFHLLLRSRQYCDAQMCWLAWERKRGKLEQLNRFLIEGDGSAFHRHVGTHDIPHDIRFVVTVDADTTLPTGVVRKLVGTLAHPLNQAQFDPTSGRLVSGYTIVQPRVEISPQSGSRSLFTRLFAGDTSIDIYSRAVSNVYQDLFGAGIFVGKGIYDLRAFHRSVAGRVPENTILSHDLFEGAHGRVALASDIVLFEGFPDNYVEYARRAHRWIRGDWQLLPWLTGSVRLANGERASNPIGGVDRWKIIDNLRRSLVAPATIMLAISGWLILPGDAWFWSLLAFFMPAGQLFTDLITGLARGRRRGASRSLFPQLRDQAGRWLLAIVYLLADALLSLHAIAVTLWRLLFSRRNLLEWTSAAHSSAELDTSRARTLIWRRMWLGPALSLAFATLLAVTNPTPLGAALPLLALWVAAPEITLAMARQRRDTAVALSEDDRLFLRKLARKTWLFFETFAGPEDNWLPPDNYQGAPHEEIAHRTSPTNIGMLLLSTAAAWDLGYISRVELAARTANLFATLDRLERYRGHFYNWYDTATLTPLEPRYVSTVDSGNLAAALVAYATSLRDAHQVQGIERQRWAGLADAIELIEEVADSTDDAVLPSWIGKLRNRLEEIKGDPPRWAVGLQDVCDTLIPDMKTALGLNGAAVPAAPDHSTELEVLIDRLQYQMHSMCRDLADGRPPVVDLISLADRAIALAYAMEFGPLYDRHRRLLRIGINVSTGRPDTHFYDLLASEARLASFFAIAKGDVPPEHWFHLGRPLRRVEGGAMLISWNGSMFEYLMPRLLLKPEFGTLLGESERMAVEVQQRYGKSQDVPWGISESAFSARDPEHHYKYQGFGIPEIGLKRGLARDLVVAPYAAALALAVAPKEAIANLKQLARSGGYGRYGFIEALDYTPERSRGTEARAVNAYMAHHQGMLLTGIANALFSDRFVRRFTDYPPMRPTLLLLSERVPREIPPEIDRLVEHTVPVVRGAPIARPASWQPKRSAAVPQMLLLGNGPLSSWISNSGSGQLRWHHRALTRFVADATLDADGSWLYIAEDATGQMWSATPRPTGADAEEYQVTCHAHLVEISRRNLDVTSRLEIGVLAGSDIEVRRLQLINETALKRDLRVTSYAEIVLGASLDDERHPAFSKLFVGSDHIAKLGGLVFERRARAPHETPPALFHFALDGAGPVQQASFETDRRTFIGRNRNLRSPKGATEPLRNTKGWTLDPIMALQHTISLAPFETREICFLTVAAATREAAIELAERHATLEAIEWALHDTATENARLLGELGVEARDLPALQELASCLIFPGNADSTRQAALAENSLSQSDLWGMGLSGDSPLLLLKSAGETTTLLPVLLGAHRWWRRHGLEVDLVILQLAGSAYIEPVLEQLRETLHRARMPELLGRKGGVHIVFADQIGADRVRLLESISRVTINDAKGSLQDQLEMTCAPLKNVPLFSAALSPQHPALAPLERPKNLQRDNGIGGFTPDGREYVIFLQPGQTTPAPWCNILANSDFGALVSEAGGGYTWAVNSGENRLTTWSNDPVTDRPSESLYLRDEETGEVWTVTPAPLGHSAQCEIRHGAGYTMWTKRSYGLEQQVEMFVPREASAKIIRLRIRNLEERHRRLTATYYAEWLLGSLPSIAREHIVCRYNAETRVITAVNRWNADFSERVAFLTSNRPPHGFTTDRGEFIGKHGDPADPGALKRWGLSNSVRAGGDTCAAYQVHLDLAPDEEEEVLFVLGQGCDHREALELAQRWREPKNTKRARAELEDFWDETLGALQIHTPDPAFDVMVNRWFLYQTLSSRIFARTGFYQSSGAFGFRDQLQDVLALLHTEPSLARAHILEAARHQFAEGDVLHWWHPPADRGVRTHFSDDLLWLPYAVGIYVGATGDVALLDEEVPFLVGEELAPDEANRYAQFDRTEESRPLFDHCERALHRAYVLGTHGLPLMGSGDWNDGMDRIGDKGSGESVWLAWFCAVCADGFADICRRTGRLAAADEWSGKASRLRQSAEQSGWDGAWYRRAFDDEGRPVGSATNEDCRIDSIAQSWAAFASGDNNRVRQALQSAWELLVSQDEQLASLLWPAFDKGPNDPGYIKAYPPGIRENGGQYSHAAAWLAMAFAKIGDPDKAYAIFNMINPVTRSDEGGRAEHYRLEPYAVAGDISANNDHRGRGGWSWYTGAAGWAWQLATHSILGLKKTEGRLVIDPCIPKTWGVYNATMRVKKGLISIRVEDPAGIGCGDVKLTVNGQPHAGNSIPLPEQGATIEVVACIIVATEQTESSEPG